MTNPSDPPAMTNLPRPSADEFGPLVRVTTPTGEREVNIYSEEGFRVLSQLWTRSNWHNRLSYEVTWLGIPIIQLPEDMVVMQELIWKVRPDVIVESGVAHGGALVLYASILELLGRGRVIGVDVEIRKYNRLAIEAHPLSHRIELIEGDSLADETVRAVRSRIRPGERVLVALDSAHTREHVLRRAAALRPARHAQQLRRGLRCGHGAGGRRACGRRGMGPRQPAGGRARVPRRQRRLRGGPLLRAPGGHLLPGGIPAAPGSGRGHGP